MNQGAPATPPVHSSPIPLETPAAVQRSPPRRPMDGRSRTTRQTAPREGRLGPWGRRGCMAMQPVAGPCNAGDATSRHFSLLQPFADPKVASSSLAGRARKISSTSVGYGWGVFVWTAPNPQNTANVQRILAIAQESWPQVLQISRWPSRPACWTRVAPRGYLASRRAGGRPTRRSCAG